MENCVGERNHPLFVAYLALQLAVLLWALYLAWWVSLVPWVWGRTSTPQAPSSGASHPLPNCRPLGRPCPCRRDSSGSLSLSFPCRSGLRFFQPWGLWLRSSGLLFATFLLLSLFSLVASLLLASHLYLVASNTTTWEFISSHRIAYLRQRPGNPFDRGLTRNLAHFFCGWPSGSWETLWAEDEEEEGSSQAV